MPTLRTLVRSTLALGAFGLLATMIACGADGGDGAKQERAAGTSDPLTMCQFGYSRECTPEGPGGSMVCTACEPIHSFWDDVQGGDTANRENLPDGKASTYLSSLGCSVSVIASGYPMFMCPTTAEPKLHGISWFGYPECPVVNVDGILKAQALTTGPCETMLSMTDTTYWATVTNEPTPGNEMVTIRVVPQNDLAGDGDGGTIITGGCQSGCSTVIPH